MDVHSFRSIPFSTTFCHLNFQFKHLYRSICVSLHNDVFKRPQNDLGNTGDDNLSIISVLLKLMVSLCVPARCLSDISEISSISDD